MKRLLIVILFCLTTLPGVCFGEDFHETRLNSGLSSSEAYSYLLIEKARDNRGRITSLLAEALEGFPGSSRSLL